MKKFENNEKGFDKMKNYIIKNFGDFSKYKIKNIKNISSIFLAGAPGAGKTEFLETIFEDLKKNFIIIDIDKYRVLFKGYNGDNASQFQKGAVRVAEKILKFCFKENLNFVFDGTFRNYNKVKENLNQCNKKKRKTLVVLIFQDPRISFYYTYLRKLKKSRNVPIDVFVDGFYNSIKNYFKVINEFDRIDFMIANKKYHPFNKNKYNYVIDYNIKSISLFCKKNNISYERGKFVNIKGLKFDLQKFLNILNSHFFGKEKSKLNKLKIWLLEKLYKLF